MMALVIVENIRGYFGSRPPLVAFMIFLGSMAVGLVTFAYFASDMPKAAIDQEFNTFMERLSSVNLCVGRDSGSSQGRGIAPSSDPSLFSATDGGSVRGSASPQQQQQQPATASVVAAAGNGGYVERMKQDPHRPALVKRAVADGKVLTSTVSSTAASSLTGASLVNVSMMMTVEVAAGAGFPGVVSTSHHHNTTTITAPLLASQLGQAKRDHDIEGVMTMVLPALANHSVPCQFLSAQGKGAAQCHRVKACVTITAPRQFFPRTMRPDRHDVCHREAVNPVQGDIMLGFERCGANATWVHLQHIFDSQNHAIAFMQEQSTINLHLMHSSYFLFVMVISLFCYAIIRGRPAKVKMMHTQNGNSDKHTLIHV